MRDEEGRGGWGLEFKIVFSNPNTEFKLLYQQINPGSLALWCIKGTDKSTPRRDSSFPLMGGANGGYRLRTPCDYILETTPIVNTQ